VADSDGKGSLFRRLRETFSEGLHNKRVDRAVKILVGILLFVAGIVFERWFSQEIDKLFGGPHGGLKLILFLLTFSAIVLVIAASVLIGGQSEILRSATEQHEKTREEITSRFGLTAEYIADKDHAYRRTQELVEKARKSLIFVDRWVYAPGYDDTPARIEYYDAIRERIDTHLKEIANNRARRGDFVHERLVQMPEGTNPGDVSDVLSKDKVYWQHISACIEQAESGKAETYVYIAEPFTHIHFAIIDDLYFVQPILATRKNSLTRYGAIIFTDPNKVVIDGYELLMNQFRKTPLQGTHMNESEHGTT
jgi:hypothetical protein